ncbi:protein maelstrom homolog [Bombina bombina]|uniref:protein maelstrom homolog n=1 Tax=Bombina bombina TaxID=8345 RepID=UPI00235AABD8|nr:protein maelstrom homolog [Bombina bombina]
MPNKRPSRNAYFFFALDMIPELRRKGMQVSEVRDAIPLCLEYWQVLSIEEKEKYAEKAKEWKNSEPETNFSDSFRKKVPRNLEMWQPGATAESYRQKQTILQKFHEDPSHSKFKIGEDWNANSYSKESVFYFLNIFSHGEMPANCEQRFVPCEIGCVRFSLCDGIMGSFHEFIDPGDLPHGFRYHCQAGSSSTHQIPISGFELSNSNYHSLFRELCGFVCPAPGMWSPVFCKEDVFSRNTWCLQWLADKAGMENHFELQNVEDLIITFYKQKLNEEPSLSSVCRLLDAVQWDFASNTRCKWHEENDMWCCAVATCKKVTYCISKALSSVYGVSLTPAHLPDLQKERDQNSDNPEVIVLDAKRFQMQRNKCSKYNDNHIVISSNGNQNCALEPRGVEPYKISAARGRGILRLLGSFNDSHNNGQ